MVATIDMLVDLHYAYLVGDLMFGVGWLALFLWRRDLFQEMSTIGRSSYCVRRYRTHV